MHSRRMLLALISAGLPASCAEVGVSLYNVAGQAASTVAAAKGVVQRVFGGAGLTIVWTDGDPNHPDAHTVYYPGNMTCPAPASVAQVRIRLISNTPVSVPPSVLGVAYPCSNAGLQGTIYSDHAQALSRQLRAPVATILGYAVVHEVGHVLLRSNSHSLEGIMKERWLISDWQSAMAHCLQFTEEQVAQMQCSVSKQPKIGFCHI